MNKFNLAAVLVLTAVSLSAESFTYQTIAVPGATSTNPVGIDNQGQIVGNYTNSTGTYGFIDTSGTFATLPGVSVINVSSNGTLLVSTSTGYATYVNGTYSPLTIPGYAYLPPQYSPPVPITPVAINNSGQLLGDAEFGENEGQFLVTGNQLTLISEQMENSIFTTGLNNQAEAVGTEYIIDHSDPSLDTALGAIYNPSTASWTSLQAPGYEIATVFNAINNLGQIVGSAALDAYPPYPQAVLYSSGVFTYLAVPNSIESQATGINDLGEIVGTEGSQGFLAVPAMNTAVPEPFTGVLSVLGLAVCCVLKTYLRFDR